MLPSGFGRQLTLVALCALLLSLVSPIQASAQQATVELNPNEGPPGTQVQATGRNWTPGTRISGPGGEVVVGDDGTFTMSFSVPSDAQPGVRQFQFDVVGQRWFVVANFMVTDAPVESPQPCNDASVTFSDTSGTRGLKVTVTGSGWVPGGTVTARLESAPPDAQPFAGSATVSESGDWQMGIEVGITPAGEYVFLFEEQPQCSISVTQTFTVTAPEAATDTSIPGGTWVSPDHDFVITGSSLHFAAHAYDNDGGSGVAYVNFTVSYPGKDWFVACKETAPSNTDVYECDWDLAQAGVPNGASGPLTVSVDVYDKAGNHNLAPHGVRGEGAWSVPMRGQVRESGYDPGQGDHVKRDYWAVDLVSDSPGVYPARAGNVVYAQENCQKLPNQPYCYGNVVALDHGNGLYSIYAHLAANGLPKVGQSVGVNDQIGTMAATGCPGCPAHLHFASRSGPADLGANALFGSDTPIRTPWA